VAELRRRAEVVAGLSARLAPPLERRLRESRGRLADLDRRAAAGLVLASRRRRERLALAFHRLEALSPLGVLRRGYSLTTTAEGRVVRSARDVRAGDRLRTRLADGGGLESRVEHVDLPEEEAR
jgi:exodeoxyribonuclease VII large subunit